jgi:GT2 family glycosyltransferase
LEIIIVDNASTDGTKQWVTDFARGKPHIKVILNEKNVGFSAGNNIGIDNASGEYIILLNNDTFVTPNWIKNLLDHFTDPRVGLVGPVTNNIGNQAKIDVPDYHTEKEFINLGLVQHYNNYRKQYELREGSLAFFCIAIRRSIIKEIGYLDENFGYGWFEDDDYCLRVRQAGYITIIADDVLIHHEHSASFNKLEEKFRLKLFETNRLYFEKKHNTKWIPHVYER